ncbi:MAG: hypothetical protein ACLFNJ_10620 [Bacteroidales bacterium]
MKKKKHFLERRNSGKNFQNPCYAGVGGYVCRFPNHKKSTSILL